MDKRELLLSAWRLWQKVAAGLNKIANAGSSNGKLLMVDVPATRKPGTMETLFSILAVADHDSNFLRSYLASPRARDLNFNFLCACGDLGAGYLDFISTATNHVLYYVDGNHDLSMPAKRSGFDREDERSGQGINLHGQVIGEKQVLFCGFGGAKAFKTEPGFYSEAAMSRVVGHLRRKIGWIRWWCKLQGKTCPPVVVLSHTPPFGLRDEIGGVHEGFKCFNKFIAEIQPRLWLHGHVHLGAFNQIRRSEIKNTTVLNVYEFKLIQVEAGAIRVTYQLP